MGYAEDMRNRGYLAYSVMDDVLVILDEPSGSTRGVRRRYRSSMAQRHGRRQARLARRYIVLVRTSVCRARKNICPMITLKHHGQKLILLDRGMFYNNQ